MNSKVKFADEKLKESFERLLDSKTEDKQVYEWICRAFENLEQNAFCGIRIPKHLIPKIYIERYKIDNLWKYNLPRGWQFTLLQTGKFASCQLLSNGLVILNMKGDFIINSHILQFSKIYKCFFLGYFYGLLN
jgi:hypothetical protein